MPLEPGVYIRDGDGQLQLAHGYLGDHYELVDIKALFDLGQVRGDDLLLDARALRELKVMADAESFDHAPEFISMCLDIVAAVPEQAHDAIELVSVG